MAAVAMIAAVMAVTAVVAAVGSAVIARHRAQAAADLAAHAGALALVSGRGAACERAVAVAARTGAVRSDCDVEGLDVVVTVTVVPGVRLAGSGPATAAARAGPV